jgi:outer membrane protein TolC
MIIFAYIFLPVQFRPAAFTEPGAGLHSPEGEIMNVHSDRSLSRIGPPAVRRYGKTRVSFLTVLAAIAALLFALTPPSWAQIAEGDLLTISRAIEIALRSQPNILAGRFVVRANEARIGQARSNYFPQISASGSYSRVSPAASGRTGSVTTPGSGAPGTGTASAGTSTSSASNNSYDVYTSSIGLSQMVYDFGRTSSQVRINNRNTESARFDLENIQDTVVLNVKQAYFNVLQAQRNREVAKASVKQFEQHLNQARGFFEVGTKAKFDVTKAEVDLSNAELNQIRAENQVRLTLVTLNNAMGIPNAPDYRLEDSLFYTEFELPFDKALQTAYAGRPDLQSLIRRKEASREAINLAGAGYYPQLTGNANYYYTGTDFPLGNGWSFGLNISVPIFNGFLTRYQVAEARANFGTSEANEQSLRLDIYSQVQQGYLTLREAAERITTSRLAIRQAKENVELATGRYQAGVGNPLEVTDAVVAQNNAEVNYTAALTDYKNAQAAIEKAIGVR